MNNNTKANDWVVALVDNPTFGLENFKDVGLSADNTVLQDKNTYRNSQYIQDKFQDNTGKFDETAFNKFYSNAASLYQAFANNQFEDDILSDTDFDPYDALRPKGAEDKTRKPGFDVVRVNNPDRLKSGISRVGRTDEREWTVSELAQKERVFDYETKQWKDYTPNDRTLFGNLGGFISSLSEPLVIAQWEDEGYHTDFQTGRRVKHKKGDYKYNEEGNYYYETLGGREAYGKQFKSVFDSFTVDGSNANKYDFFDSDSLDKSVTGTVMKTVATLAPLFIPGVGGYYGAALVGANLLDILPSIYKSTVGLAIDSETPTLNLMQGIGRSLKGSKSEYSKNHLVSTENFFDLVTDVSLQWAQQRAIFSAFNKLAGTGKLEKAAAKAAEGQVERAIASDLSRGTLRDPKALSEMAMQIQSNKLKPLLEARNRMAADAALGYMATMAGIESFESAIEQGADRVEAAAVAWGSIAGMFVWDRTGIGEIFFPELKGEQLAYRKAIESVGKEVTKGFEGIAATAAQEGRKKGLARMFNWAKNKSSDFWKGVNDHSLTFAGKAFGEGIEEVGEELIMDFAKSTFNWAQEFGFTKTDVHLDAWENMAERYGMSFFGGAIGGAIFAGVDLVQNNRNPEQLNQELIYLIRNGKTNEIVEELGKMRDKGKLGNKNLSSTKYEADSKDPNKLNWLSPTSTEDNQNQATYNMIKNYIQSLDSVIHQEGLAYSDDELLDKMFMGDQRMKALLEFGKAEGDDYGPLMASGYNGKLLQDWNTLTSDILKIEGQLRELNKQYPDTDKGGSPSKNSEEYAQAKQRLLTEKQELQNKRDSFLNGQYSQYYADQMLFAIDSNVNRFFFDPTFKDYAETQSHKNYEDLSPAELDQLKADYETYRTGARIDNLDVAFEIYKELNKKGSIQVGENGEKYKEFLRVRDLVRQQLVDLELTKDKLESTSEGDIELVEEIFNNLPGRNTITPEIKDELRIWDRVVDPNLAPDAQALELEEIDLHNAQALQNLRNIVTQFQQIGTIDPQTKNLILNALKSPLPQQIIENVKDQFFAQGRELPDMSAISGLDSKVQDVVNNLTPQNIQESKQALQELFESKDADDWADTAAMAEEMMTGVPGDPATKKQAALAEYTDFIDSVEQAMSSDPTLQIVAQLESDVMSISDNPIYGLLKQFSVNTFGKPIDIFEVLEQENTRFGNAQTASEYVLDPNAEQQVDQGLMVLDMTEAIINASSTHEFNSEEPYGHNQTMNYFLETYFPNEDRYGIVAQDLAEKMKQDLNEVRRQLLFLKELSRINAINQFSKHKQTGKVITRLLSDIMKGKGEYGFLKDLEYDGHKLFQDIDQIATPVLDSDQNTDEIFLESDKVYDKIHENFKQIVEETGASEEQVLEGLFSNVRQKFSEDSLIGQKNSQFDPQTKALEDFDIYLWLTSLMALKRSDFNYYLREVLKEDNVKFAPLFAQEYTAQLAIAFLTNPIMFNKAIDAIMNIEGDKGKELIKLSNTIMINGIGGAGKTSVVAKLIAKISQQLYPNSTIYKVGPTTEQAKNLSVSLGTNGKEFTIDALMKEILGEEQFGKLQNDIKNKAETSSFYNIEKYPGNYKVARAVDIDYSNNPAPKIVFLDEATHANSIYLQHLANWAQKNNVLIVAMGDLLQNGYLEPTGGFYNIDSDSTMTVRTPKLRISMRINNIQKDTNTKTALAVMDSLDINQVTKQFYAMDAGDRAAYETQKAAEFKQLIQQMLVFHRYQDENSPLNGERLVRQLDTNMLSRMLEKGEVGVVYDNEGSETYKAIQDFINNNPELGKKITLYTPREVQGSEKEYFIIDLDYSKSDLNKSPVFSYDFMKNIYTMMTRSKVGTLFIDNGLSNIIPEKNFMVDDYTNETPNPEQIIKDFRDNKLEILDATLEGYNPTLLPREEDEEIPTREDSSEESDEDSSSESEPENTPGEPRGETSGPSSAEEETTPSTEGASSEESLTPGTPSGVTVTGGSAEATSVISPVPQGQDGIADEFLDKIQGTTNPNIDSPEALKGIRAYGWYMRYGCNEQEVTNGSTKYTEYTRRQHTEGILDDLNVFMKANVGYTSKQLKNQKAMLNSVRNYLTFGTPFDANFLELLKSRGFGGMANFGKDEAYALSIWNGGTFKLVVRKNDEVFDRARDKNGYDASKVEPVAFNIIYEVKVNDKMTYQFTIGKLTKPETWKAWLDGDGKNQATQAVMKSYRAYDDWYRKQSQDVMANEQLTRYYDIPKDSINFAAATRLKAVPEGDGKKRFDLDSFDRDNPNAIRSPLYIYAGHKGNLGGIKDAVKGKAVIFVTANKDLVIDGEKVTSENIASMYIKQNLNRKNTTPLIRMVIVEPKGMFIGDSNPKVDKVEQEGFFSMSFSDLVDSDNKLDINAVKSKLGTIGSSTTASRMIVAIWNYRAGLARLEQIIKENPDMSASELNQIIEQKNKNSEFRIKEVVAGTDANGRKPYEMGTTSDGQTVRVLITKRQALAQKAMLDSIIDLFSGIVTLPSTEGAELYAMSTKPYEPGTKKTKAQQFYENILKDVDGTDAALTFKNGDKIFKHEAFSKSGAFKVVSILSAIYKLYDPKSKDQWKASSYEVNTTNSRREKVTLSLSPLSTVVSQAVNANGLAVAPSTFVRNTLNMIFHGKLNPYNKDITTHRSYAPFPQGILYHPRYVKHTSGAPVADFYPASNVDGQFTYDVAVEHSNFEVNVDLTKLKESAPIESINSAEKAAIDLKINNFAAQLQNIQVPGLDIDLTINRLRSRSEKDGMAALNQEIEITHSIITNLLNEAVSKGTLMIGNDRSLKSELQVAEDGTLSVQHTLLTEALKSENGVAIPVNEDGSVDYSQITNIEYNGGNNENFVLTLQNGNTIMGTISGTNIEIQDQTLLTIALNKDQRDLFQEFDDAFGKGDLIDSKITNSLIKHLLMQEQNTSLTSVEGVKEMLDQAVAEMEAQLDNIENIEGEEEQELFTDTYGALLEMQEQVAINSNLICKI